MPHAKKAVVSPQSKAYGDSQPTREAQTTTLWETPENTTPCFMGMEGLR